MKISERTYNLACIAAASAIVVGACFIPYANSTNRREHYHTSREVHNVQTSTNNLEVSVLS
jgi:hypothetical protein